MASIMMPFFTTTHRKGGSYAALDGKNGEDRKDAGDLRPLWLHEVDL